jgi:hypothetical protein
MHLSVAAHHLLGDLTSSISASDQGVEQGTHKKQHLAWTRWTKWLTTVELLRRVPRSLSGLELVSSAPSLPPYDPLSFSGPAHLPACRRNGRRPTVNHVASAFVDSGFADPRKHGDGSTSRFLQRQYKCYRNLDSDVKQQRPSRPPSSSTCLSMRRQPVNRQPEELAVGAFSSQCSPVNTVMSTAIVGPNATPSGPALHQGNRSLSFPVPLLASADAIAITFEFQKTDIRSETLSITISCTLPCPSLGPDGPSCLSHLVATLTAWFAQWSLTTDTASSHWLAFVASRLRSRIR